MTSSSVVHPDTAARRKRGAPLSERAFLTFLLLPGVVLLCAIVLYPRLEAFLQQEMSECATHADSAARLGALLGPQAGSGF